LAVSFTAAIAASVYILAAVWVMSLTKRTEIKPGLFFKNKKMTCIEKQIYN
jgi:hypothetical protein